MRRRLIACAVAALAALPAAAQTVRGVVRAEGKPLADVQVRVELDGRSRTAAAADAQGRYAIDLAALFGAPARPAGDLALRFDKPGFKPLARVLRVAEAAARPLEVALLPESGKSTLAPEEEKKLEPLVTRVGTGPLVLVPYDLPADAFDTTAERLNERLRANLERLILTHVQAALHGVDTSGLALKLLPVAGARDAAQLRAYGQFVNALAVVSGSGDKAPDGADVLVSSSYVIIPRTDAFQPPLVFVDDRVRANLLTSPELHRHLSKLWGRITVLAVAVRDLKEAGAIEDVAQRRAVQQRVRGYLVAERAAAGPGNEQLLPALNDLIAQIDKELR